MVAPEVQGIDLFKIANRSISGWIPSLKTGTTIRQPFCSQLEERLLLWLEYHPQDTDSYEEGSPAKLMKNSGCLLGTTEWNDFFIVPLQAFCYTRFIADVRN